MDLNEASLNAALNRVSKENAQVTVKHDVFETYPESLHNQFDSISMFYLLHCLLGNILEKNVLSEMLLKV